MVRRTRTRALTDWADLPEEVDTDTAMDTVEVVDLVKQLKLVKDEQTLFAKRYDEVKKRLFSLLDDQGAEDDKGHLVLSLPKGAVEGVASIIKQRRASVSLRSKDFMTFLADKSDKLYDECVELVPVLNDDAVHAALYRGDITEEEFERFVDRKVTWSLVQGKE
jgi:hypothetical protein